MLTEDIIEAACADLAARAEAMRHARIGKVEELRLPVRCMRGGQGAEEAVAWLKGLGMPAKHPVVYSIAASDMDVARRIVAEPEGHKSKAELGCSLPQRNTDHPHGTILYVGGSESIRQRTTQHLGKAYRDTYALNLGRWCPGIDGSIILRVQFLEAGTSRGLRQDLEDAAWTALRPAFGRKGAR